LLLTSMNLRQLLLSQFYWSKFLSFFGFCHIRFA